MAAPIAAIMAHNKKSAERMAQMVFHEDVEKIVDGITEASETMLAKSRVCRPFAQAATPERALKLVRVWRKADALMGPGKSVLQVLLARYIRLQDVVEEMSLLLRRGLRASESSESRRLLLGRMDHQLKKFRKLKSDIADDAAASAGDIAKKLQAEMEGAAKKKLVSATQIKKECQTALNEMEQTLANQRKAMLKNVDGTPGTKALQAKAEAYVTIVKKTPSTGRRAFISSRIRRVMDFKNGQKMAVDFAKTVKKKLRRTLPLLDDVEDSAPFFMEALGVAASAKPEGAKLLRRYAEQGASALNPDEMKKISGYLGQMRGLLPEEVATRMKFLESVFHKNAFEVLSDFPPAFRGQMGVEMVEGPLWVFDHTGAPRQFGDGAMLLTGPNGQSAIIGLGEFKAGFDDDLFTQLFQRSDGRAVNAKVTFLGANGESQVRTLTREFSFEGGTKVAVTKPPTYVYGRPIGETGATAEQFEKLVEDEMKSGREVWKVPLPLSVKANERFAQEALKEAVNAMKKAKKNWGR